LICSKGQARGLKAHGAVTAAHRFDALARDRHQQSQAVIAHRLLSIGMTQHRAERLDIGRKSRFTPSLAPPFNPLHRSGKR
jgi:hypothetical protein